ncbi:response regulator [Pseudomonas putida]|uniref:response regulator n=1 Tax=Pseudomonas putida TaxID=303 RepID=UPI001EE8915B|nr:response regulator [Pseudomonas putida]
MNNPKRVLLIDDHPLFRRGLVNLLMDEDDFTVVGEAANGVEGVAMASRLKPDLVLLDLHMAMMDGLKTLSVLKGENLADAVVILTASVSRQEFLSALKGGADGYILKDTSAEKMLALLRNEDQKDLMLDDDLQRVFQSESTATLTLDGLKALTDRERQTLELIARGMSNKLIAREMGLSEGTVKIYVGNILRKLEVSSRLEIAALVHGYSNLEGHK